LGVTNFCAIGFFNEADTIESSSVLIYSEVHTVNMHNVLDKMPH